jgi:hypothetical protein
LKLAEHGTSTASDYRQHCGLLERGVALKLEFEHVKVREDIVHGEGINAPCAAVELLFVAVGAEMHNTGA